MPTGYHASRKKSPGSSPGLFLNEGYEPRRPDTEKWLVSAPGIVLLAVYIARRAVLTAVQCAAVSLRQMTVIRFPHLPLLVIDASLLAFQLRRFVRRQMAALGALRDSRLLIFFPLMDRLGENARRAEHQQRRAADQSSSYVHGVFLSLAHGDFQPV